MDRATGMSEECQQGPAVPPPDLGIDGVPELVYQPAVDLASGRLLGFEALLRWHVPGPDQAFIAPGDLIPWAVAERRMGELNAWILLEACTQASRWGSELQVAVNCTHFELRGNQTATAVSAALEASGLMPDRLSIEVDEGALDDADAVDELRAIVVAGVHLTMDDVGSDWSVLELLEHLPVNTVKIDRALVREIEEPETPNRAAAATIVGLSRALRICTVAQGIETQGQLDLLRAMGTDVGQGYFFSPPVTGADVEALAGLGYTPRYALDHPRRFVTAAPPAGPLSVP